MLNKAAVLKFTLKNSKYQICQWFSITEVKWTVQRIKSGVMCTWGVGLKQPINTREQMYLRIEKGLHRCAAWE